ncbi:MAG: DUF2341 domain-containing protein [Acidobacteriaceae bacterium]|nr:DUF2341 domain-containing protein [Acidobacteriaceae bacterium]
MSARWAFGLLFLFITLFRPASGQTLIIGETPAGTVDGKNAVFTLANSPSSNVALYKNGLRQRNGVDYSANGMTIQFSAQATPLPGDTLVADYAGQSQPIKPPTPTSPGQYSRAITIDHTKVPNTDQTNFPVLISGVYSYLAGSQQGGHVQNPSGYDILFTSDAAGQNPLNSQIESYNAVTGAVNIWVQLPEVSHTADTTFYMFYGNSATTAPQGNPTATWDSNYKGVYHLAGSMSLAADATANANNGTIDGATPTPGQINGAAAFSGSSQYLTMGNVLDLGSSDFTLSAWAAPANQSQFGPIVSKRQNSGGYQQYVFGVGSVNSYGSAAAGKTIFLFLYDGATLQSYHTANNIVDGHWHDLVATRTSSGINIYVDGVNQPLVADAAGSASENIANSGLFDIGFNSGFNFYTGSIDEVRVSNIARSSDWIATEFNNQSSPATFYTIGSEVTQTSAAGSAISAVR